MASEESRYRVILASEVIITILTYICIQNAFWNVENSDPYAALSWDRLHAYHGGLFSDHIWPEILDLVAAQGKRMSQLVDDQCVILYLIP